MSKDIPSDMDLLADTPHIIQYVQIPARQAHSNILPYLPSSGIEYDQRHVDQDKLSTYTSLDDYDAMFKARHGRGAIDNMTITGGRVSATSPVMVPTPAISRGVTENPLTGTVSKHTPVVTTHFLVNEVKLLWRDSINPQQSVMLYHLWVQDIYWERGLLFLQIWPKPCWLTWTSKWPYLTQFMSLWVLPWTIILFLDQYLGRVKLDRKCLI